MTRAPGWSRARVVYAASERDADILYPTRFLAPDPFLFVQKGGRRTIVLSDLEIDRARREAAVDKILSWSRIAARVERRGEQASPAAVIGEALRVLGIRRADVPWAFPSGLARELESAGLRLTIGPDPFWPERAIKSPAEIRAVERALRAAEAGIAAGIEALRSCRVRRDGFLARDGRIFEAEDLRAAVDMRVIAEGAIPQGTICAPGDQAVDPHGVGHGPIRAHVPVVIDVFPRSARTGYFGDLSRTVVRGRAPERLKEVYGVVSEAVELAFSRLREGASGQAIHQEIHELFVRRGYPTGVRAGRRQGFFHGTGHGLGLDLHEAPSISKRPAVLRAGHVVTVEPGLYYLGLGGVRIEDVAVVGKLRARNLTRAPKVLEV
jgi:Xaa-Pro aminopeptidase